MAWAETYALRYVNFGISRNAAEYGAGNYGDLTYGQEATDPLSNVEYTLVPKPGEFPAKVGWLYRAGDADVPFQAQVLGLDGPMNLTSVSTAALVLERVSVGQRVLHALPVTTGTTDGLISADLPASVLAYEGVYRVAVQLQFSSGRCMSITSDDSVTLSIRGQA